VNRTVVFYKTTDGKCPVQDFLDSLPGKVAQKAGGKLIGTEEIWECRIQFGSNAYRVLCFFLDRSVIVLTHGFVKKSQKTPVHEIERAEAYRKDFLKRRT
jgi:phage-related protein